MPNTALRLLAVAGIALAMFVPQTAVAAPPTSIAEQSSTSGATCQVHNATQDVFYGPDNGKALADAIDDAERDDVLDVSGRCVGSFYVPDEARITVRGASGLPRPTLAAGDPAVIVVAGRLRLRRVVLSEGVQGMFNMGFAHVHHVLATNNQVGLTNQGDRLGVIHSTIRDNTTSPTSYGAGGIENGSGHLTVRSSVIAKNVGLDFGGGIQNRSAVATYITDSRITHNSAPSGGGIAHLGSNELQIANTRISGNHADTDGGGIFTRADLFLHDTNKIIGNDATDGGGIFIDTTSGYMHSDGSTAFRRNVPNDCTGC